MVAEFKQFSVITNAPCKSKTFDKSKSFDSMMAGLCTVFEFVGLAYHAKFTHLPEHDPDWKVPEKA